MLQQSSATIASNCRNTIMKFCANLSFMFTERPYIERYQLAKDAGFKYVEAAFPCGYSVEDVTIAKEKSGVEQILINIHTAQEGSTKGRLGIACDPAEEAKFRQSLKLTVEYAKSLKCKFVHIMAGTGDDKSEANWKAYETNLKYAVGEMQKENIIGLIEPINRRSLPNYFMNSYERAVDIIKRIDSKNLRLMLDLFHLQHIKGNITNNFNELLPYVGHIQIAQVPHRNEPNTAGELDYKYILNLIENSEYEGYIGLEYKPLNGTKQGLNWIEEYRYHL